VEVVSFETADEEESLLMLRCLRVGQNKVESQ